MISALHPGALAGRFSWVFAASVACAACSGDAPATTAGPGAGGSGGSGGGDAGGGEPGRGGSGGGGGSAACVAIGEELVELAVAREAGEAILTFTGSSDDASSSWGTNARESLVLEVTRNDAFVGHVLLHQGARPTPYAMTLGALDEGDVVRARVSELSSVALAKSACAASVVITPVDALPDPEGARHAPIFVWPRAKRYDDVPVMVGYSAAKKSFEALFSNEDGGTPVLCGGGAEGLASEIAQWGRALDIETALGLDGAEPHWHRCTGETKYSEHQPVLEGDHPVFYYGDGHNGLFESRGGYGQKCGSAGDRKADGDLAGWNVENPGNGREHDAPYSIVLRPVPVSLDALGYAFWKGRREAMVDRYAPELYKLAGDEVEREGKVDNDHTWPWTQYAYLDVHVSSVGGAGEASCTVVDAGGFKIRLHTRDGKTIEGPRITGHFVSGDDAWKRVAVPLGGPIAASDLASVELDAYNNDGIYWVELGDVFVPTLAPDGTVKLDYAHQGDERVQVYVDDDSSGCSNGENIDGPSASPFKCTGSDHIFGL